jgi:hypothetical protein
MNLVGNKHEQTLHASSLSMATSKVVCEEDSGKSRVQEGVLRKWACGAPTRLQ